MSKEQLFQDYQEIMKYLSQNKYIFQYFPDSIPAVHNSGEAFSIAYPIQGLLKYHGMVNKDLRIAYFPSISLNNDSVETITYMKFDHQLNEDRVILNGKEISKQSREFIRISYQLDKIRAFASVSTCALIISRNIKTKSGIIAKGKGLGTSASGGAAITRAALQILYSGREDIIKNPQLNSYLSRFLAGSASRSCVGGIGLWLNHPKISSKDSIAIRLDRKDDQNFIKSIDLITVSLESPIKTEQIHELAPRSPFFNNWLEGRKEKIIEFIDALQTHNLEKLGELTEFDTMALHAVTMTADPKENLVLWNAETVEIIHFIQQLRKREIIAHFSIDTGPSVVILTTSPFTERIFAELKSKFSNLDITKGKIGGPSRILDRESSEAKILSEDLVRYL